MKTQISILGCGWLGFPLAQFLISKDHQIKGSTTSQKKMESLEQHGIKSYLINLTETSIIGSVSEFIKGSEIVIINIPPGLRKNPSKNHVIEIQHLIDIIEKERISNVIYVSSTGVFKDQENFPIISITDKPNNISKSYRQLIEIEQRLLQNSYFNTTVLRFGGLFDKERHPARYLSGKSNIANPNAPTNLIHKNDCINIIYKIIKKDVWNVALNAAFPIHPDRKSYYIEYCNSHNIKEPKFNLKDKSVGKIIDSTHLEQLLNYSFEQAP